MSNETAPKVVNNGYQPVAGTLIATRTDEEGESRTFSFEEATRIKKYFDEMPFYTD